MTRFTVRPIPALIGIMLVVHAHLVHGQVVSGTILGTVKDPTGAVMTAVSISAKSLETGAVRSATTDRSGTYQIISVPPGTYQLPLPDQPGAQKRRPHFAHQPELQPDRGDGLG